MASSSSRSSPGWKSENSTYVRRVRAESSRRLHGAIDAPPAQWRTSRCRFLTARRSTEPARPRHRREMSSSLNIFHTGPMPGSEIMASSRGPSADGDGASEPRLRRSGALARAPMAPGAYNRERARLSTRPAAPQKPGIPGSQKSISAAANARWTPLYR